MNAENLQMAGQKRKRDDNESKTYVQPGAPVIIANNLRTVSDTVVYYQETFRLSLYALNYRHTFILRAIPDT